MSTKAVKWGRFSGHSSAFVSSVFHLLLRLLLTDTSNRRNSVDPRGLVGISALAGCLWVLSQPANRLTQRTMKRAEVKVFKKKKKKKSVCVWRCGWSKWVEFFFFFDVAHSWGPARMLNWIRIMRFKYFFSVSWPFRLRASEQSRGRCLWQQTSRTHSVREGLFSEQYSQWQHSKYLQNNDQFEQIWWFERRFLAHNLPQM